MVIGYDAYHEKGSRNVSYGAVVSSLNQGWSRYLSQAATHKNHEELSNNFALGVRSKSSYLLSFNRFYHLAIEIIKYFLFS